MTSAAVRIGALAVTLFLGAVCGAGVAGRSADPIETVTSVVSSVGGQTTVVSTATEAVEGATSGDAGPLGTTGLREARKVRTAFDRLPLRFEVLLERIEAGRAVRPNIRRLERALEAAPTRLRARILRLVRAEMRQLERGGLTPVERARRQRLRLVTSALRGADAGSASGRSVLPGSSGDPATASSGREAPTTESSGGGRPFAGGSTRSSSHGRDGDGGGEDRDVGGFGSRVDLPPAWESQVQVGLYVALFALIVVGLVALLLAAASPRAVPAGRLRRFVRASRVDLTVTGLATLIVALVLFLQSSSL
jgi:hypothetical protein